MRRCTRRYSSQRDEFYLAKNGSGRAVSRFLSAFLRTERIICLSSQYPKPVHFRGHGTSRSSVSYLALHPMGFSVPFRSRGMRWSLTPPFHPYPRRLRNTGGLFSVALSVGTTRAVAARVYPEVRLHASAAPGYAASRPVEFGLSSPDLRRERFSALPEPVRRYTKPFFPQAANSPQIPRSINRRCGQAIKHSHPFE